MKADNYQEFVEMWALTHEIMAGGKVFSKPAMDMIFETLSEHPISHISKALEIHRKTGRFAPTPSDIISIINTRTKPQHISADEAWAKCVYAFDEKETVVLTSVMLEAVAAASSVWDERNHTAARMAFRQAYERLVSTNPPIEYRASFGYDRGRRLSAVNAAVEQGLLPQTSRIAIESPADISFVVKALEQNASAFDKEKCRDAIAKLKLCTFMRDQRTDAEKEADKAAQRERKRQFFIEKKAEELRKIEQKILDKETIEIMSREECLIDDNEPF